MHAEFTQVFDLALSEKLQLVEDLWDSIVADPSQVPLLEWQREELIRRKVAYLEDPTSGSSWEAAKERIRNQSQNA
jgi:putative addiction module component (TIGR02574 family)